jgi:hypothetical protein
MPRGNDPCVRNQESLPGPQLASELAQAINAIDAKDHARAWGGVKSDDGRHAIAFEAWPAVLGDSGGDHDITDVRAGKKFRVVSATRSRRVDYKNTHLLIESRHGGVRDAIAAVVSSIGFLRPDLRTSAGEATSPP